MSDYKSDYSTQDLHITTILKAMGFQWSQVTLIGNRATFIFKQSPQLEATLNRILLGETSIEPFKLLEAQRMVKKMIREWRSAVGGEVTHGH